MPRTNRDLWALGALCLAGLLTLLLPVPGLVRGLIWTPLACLGPGYALLSTLFPHQLLGRPQLVLYSLGLSIATAIIGAVLVHVVGGVLTDWVWAGLILGVTVVAGGVALWRRPANRPTRLALEGMPALSLTLLRMAGLITLVALVLARTPLPVTGVQGYTTFWAVPAGAAASPQIHLGAKSAELTSLSYRVEARAAAGLNGEIQRFTLAPGETWEATYVIPAELVGQGAIELYLFRDDAPNQIYRQVVLWP